MEIEEAVFSRGTRSKYTEKEAAETGPSCYFFIQRGIRTLRGSERVTQAESRRASRVRGFAIFVVEVLVTLRYNVFIKTNEVTPKS